MTTIKTFYHKEDNNLGDVLTPIILHWITKGVPVQHVSPKQKGKLLAAGSIIPNKLCENDIVWGSGSLRENHFTLPKGSKVYAVRGKLTRNLIEQDISEVYGDPAILMPQIYNPKVLKIRRVGYLPHFTDYWYIRGRYGSKHTIPILQDPKETIRRMLQYEMIITSSMHGVILAEAYGIPVVWAKLIDPIYRKEKGDEFKFRDYFSVTNRKISSVPWEDAVITKNVIERKTTDPNPLLDAFTKLWKENYV